MPQNHLDKFRSCFPNPVNQQAIGHIPQVYLDKLNELCSLTLAWPEGYPTGELARTQLRALCRDPSVDVLIAYAAVMAWGGRGVESQNYAWSLGPESRAALVRILQQLRASTESRQSDFKAMQQAAEGIKGLGISFYTKLLFFFRKTSDAYILDQFTAKSAKLLFSPCEVVLTSSGFPASYNKSDSYEWFCRSVEAIGNTLNPQQPWSGETVEQAMFDVRNGDWRKYLRSIYCKARPRKIQLDI